MLQNGNAEERSFAEQQLMLIKSAFDQIAQYQTEYAIYSKFGNQKYMDEAHQLAEQARAQLSALGVSEKWYAADVNLRAHFMGSPLRALRYDPYKTDGSAMPALSEQRFAIALGMINLNYQNWARDRYEFIEAGAIAAEARRKEIPLKVEEYNKTISKQNIEYVQQYLAEINLYRGEITGKYSPELLRAVERFQDNYNSSELSAELQYKFDEVNGKIDHRVLNLIYMNKDLVEKSPRNLDMCLIPGGLEDTRSVFEKTIDYFNKSIDSFKEIGSDIMVAADERANKALDSPGDFLNYISFGIPKGIYDGYAYRAENRHESAYTYIDWLSSGVLSGVYEPFVGIFTTDDPFSKQHWLDSAGLAAQMFGIGYVRMQLKSNSKGSGGSLNANTNVDLNKTKKVETEPKKTNPDLVDNSLGNKGKDELRAWVEANLERSAAVREASRFYEYLKKEKELLEAIEKKNEGMGNGGKKFSDMSADEQLAIAKHYSQRAPIEIPENANMKAKSMADGYEQITYKWNDGTYKYEVRWHTRTSGAPADQGNTWVIQRTIPGSGGNKPQSFFKIGENEWVEGYRWYDAIAARKAGTATPEQVRILDQGHWKE
ncbi:peptidoglycan-binding protein [Paenibacillus lentus]|uniref:Peptidoglycan-binding protein n=2 Tax=Paenibacillus lentus TaxID=1338368 RepID=A0A3S8RX34_9BACL|nr:peptidoglycan-binding protein [Paenibacillus lentus]